MKRILVVEDQGPMRRNLALMLEMEDFQVFTAADGREGLDLALKEVPDLVLRDVMMPELDGLGLLQKLRGNPATAAIPFIFLTAKGEKPDIRNGMNLGADDYLTKPALRDDVLEAIQARLARKQAEQDWATAHGGRGFSPDFSSPAPLLRLGLTPREADVLLWIAQGKSNGDIATLLGMSEKRVKQHAGSIFVKLGVETRTAATLAALEFLHPPAGER